MILKAIKTTQDIIEGEEYVVLALRLGSHSQQALVYNESQSDFVDLECFDFSDSQKIPGNWALMPAPGSLNDGVYYIGGKEFVENPIKRYEGLISRNREDVIGSRLEYTRQIIDNPDAWSKAAPYDHIYREETTDEKASAVNEAAAEVFSKLSKQDRMVVYTQADAPWSLRVEKFLNENNIDYFAVNIRDNPVLTNHIIDTFGQQVVPLCVYNNEIIAVGYDPSAISNYLDF